MNIGIFDFTVDKVNNKIHVKREFKAAKTLVWEAWTNPSITDLWWAPEPYRTETISCERKKGGKWFYAMISPENEKHFCIAEYLEYDPIDHYKCMDAFTDEHGTINTDFPRAIWNIQFESLGKNTMVKIEISYETLSDLLQIIKLGFKEGFQMGLSNLDKYLENNNK